MTDVIDRQHSQTAQPKSAKPKRHKRSKLAIEVEFLQEQPSDFSMTGEFSKATLPETTSPKVTISPAEAAYVQELRQLWEDAP